MRLICELDSLFELILRHDLKVLKRLLIRVLWFFGCSPLAPRVKKTFFYPYKLRTLLLTNLKIANKWIYEADLAKRNAGFEALHECVGGDGEVRIKGQQPVRQVLLHRQQILIARLEGAKVSQLQHLGTDDIVRRQGDPSRRRERLHFVTYSVITYY